MKHRVFYGGSVALVLVAVVGLIVGGRSGWFAPDDAPFDGALRTVVVVASGEPIPTLRAGDIAVDLEAGMVPSGMHRATVLSDKDCAPDAEGVSHCLNDLRIGRAQIAVRHHHAMVEEPCFSPPEQLNVMDTATYIAWTGGPS